MGNFETWKEQFPMGKIVKPEGFNKSIFIVKDDSCLIQLLGTDDQAFKCSFLASSLDELDNSPYNVLENLLIDAGVIEKTCPTITGKIMKEV